MLDHIRRAWRLRANDKNGTSTGDVGSGGQSSPTGVSPSLKDSSSSPEPKTSDALQPSPTVNHTPSDTTTTVTTHSDPSHSSTDTLPISTPSSDKSKPTDSTTSTLGKPTTSSEPASLESSSSPTPPSVSTPSISKPIESTQSTITSTSSPNKSKNTDSTSSQPVGKHTTDPNISGTPSFSSSSPSHTSSSVPHVSSSESTLIESSHFTVTSSSTSFSDKSKPTSLTDTKPSSQLSPSGNSLSHTSLSVPSSSSSTLTTTQSSDSPTIITSTSSSGKGEPNHSTPSPSSVSKSVENHSTDSWTSSSSYTSPNDSQPSPSQGGSSEHPPPPGSTLVPGSNSTPEPFPSQGGSTQVYFPPASTPVPKQPKPETSTAASVPPVDVSHSVPDGPPTPISSGVDSNTPASTPIPTVTHSDPLGNPGSPHTVESSNVAPPEPLHSAPPSAAGPDVPSTPRPLDNQNSVTGGEPPSSTFSSLVDGSTTSEVPSQPPPARTHFSVAVGAVAQSSDHGSFVTATKTFVTVDYSTVGSGTQQSVIPVTHTTTGTFVSIHHPGASSVSNNGGGSDNGNGGNSGSSNAGGSRVNLGVIVGPILGFLLLLCALVWFIRRRRRRRVRTKHHHAPSLDYRFGATPFADKLPKAAPEMIQVETTNLNSTVLDSPQSGNPFLDPVVLNSRVDISAHEQLLSVDWGSSSSEYSSRVVSLAESETGSFESLSTVRFATATALSTATPSMVTLGRDTYSVDPFADPVPALPDRTSRTETSTPNEPSSSWRVPSLNLSNLTDVIRSNEELFQAGSSG